MHVNPFLIFIVVFWFDYACMGNKVASAQNAWIILCVN
ncbi:hypothetical protein GNIT_3089 [Glaciecola nitratireducens FR1064]|uniref:Uncharacterized protein n=1 Tax=Glaciecola nitratireducens (strain JCM 12485 / KCTC 12276 / FR1064) TaxID=1085623 RepID=G4QIM8_GLANF|nr:hypothetical protein GNIT_3089 [Glaciecola nitratireducens FR1064]